MVQNFLKITLRQFARNKTAAIINFSGLTVGLAAAMLIGLYVPSEWQTDRALPHPDRTFRLLRVSAINSRPYDIGMFGLAAYAAATRTKEIGIRKVLGASVAGIVGLLSKAFLKLVIVAFFIAAPPAYYFMDNWLTDFAYCVEIQWWVFAAAGLMAAAVAFLTISVQSLRAALANPVRSLRRE